MKKIVLNLTIGIIFCASLFILLMQGFGLPPISAVLDLILRIVVAISAQVLFWVNIKQPLLRIIPLILTVAFALWGGWLFLTSDAWVNVSLGDYFADYCTPALGCNITYILCMLVSKK